MLDREPQLRRILEGMQDAYMEDLRAIVDQESPSDDLESLLAIQRWLADYLSRLGLEVRSLGEGDILHAHTQGGAGGRIALIGHVDTVFPLGEGRRRPFRADGERAFGPGVADMKGGLLLMAYALRALRTAAVPFGRVDLVINADEEIGSPRSQSVIAEIVRGADAALVLEPGREDGSVVSARKGVGDFRVRAHGRPAHAGVAPERGRSAIRELARCVEAIHLCNGRLPGVTFNVGLIRGGTRRNVVPEWAECEVDVRTVRRSDEPEVRRLLREAVLPPRDADVEVALTGDFASPPMEKSEGGRRLVELAASGAAALGFALRDIATGGGSDGNRISAAGVPVLDALGPVGGAAHTPDEYIEIRSVPERGALLAGLIARLARDGV